MTLCRQFSLVLPSAANSSLLFFNNFKHGLFAAPSVTCAILIWISLILDRQVLRRQLSLVLLFSRSVKYIIARDFCNFKPFCKLIHCSFPLYFFGNDAQNGWIQSRLGW
jgi:hypothetical protein